MTANTAPIFVKNVTAKGTTWTNSDAANTKKTITPTVGAEGSRIQRISVVTDDTVSREFQVFFNDGTTDFIMGTVSVTAGSGNTSGVAAFSVTAQSQLATWVSTDGSFLVPTGWVVKMANVTQPTSGKTFTVVCHAGDY